MRTAEPQVLLWFPIGFSNRCCMFPQKKKRFQQRNLRLNRDVSRGPTPLKSFLLRRRKTRKTETECSINHVFKWTNSISTINRTPNLGKVRYQLVWTQHQTLLVCFHAISTIQCTEKYSGGDFSDLTT